MLVYTKTTCPYCDMAKQYLSEQAWPYTEEVYDDDIRRQGMYDRLGLVAGQRTVPQIFAVNETGIERIGGYYDLLQWASRQAVGSFNEEF